MGQKVNPIGMRLQVNRTWDSRWYASSKDFGNLLLEDLKIKSSDPNIWKKDDAKNIFQEIKNIESTFIYYILRFKKQYHRRYWYNRWLVERQHFLREEHLI